MIATGYGPPDVPGFYGAYLFYNGTEAEFNRVFTEFLAIPVDSASLGSLSYNDITHVVSSGSERTNGVGDPVIACSIRR